ncbi:MAG: TolC family protein [Vicinamibacteria bacterium]|nr:TolC family protein [Vicinamibacteria bacterium]
MRKLWSFPAAGLFLIAATVAQASPPPPPPDVVALDLRAALARALTDNRLIRAATSGVAAARADRRLAFSYILPRVSVGGSAAQHDREVSFHISDDASMTILERHDWNARIVITQPLFAGLRETRAYQQTGALVDGAVAGLTGARDQVLIQVAIDYLSLVETEALIDVERRSLDLARKRREQALALFDAGEVTRVDVLRAATAIAAAQTRLIAAEQTRQRDLGRLRVLLAIEGDIAVTEPSDLGLPLLPAEAALIERAASARADLRQAEATARVAALETRKQRGAIWPTLSAEAGYIRQKMSFPTDRYAYFMVRADASLFRGGETKARVTAARERERQAQAMAEQQRRQVSEDVRTALKTLELARAANELARDALDAAEAEYAQAFELYTNQEITAVELEASETSLASARRTAVTSRLGERKAELAAWFAAGSLSQVVMREEQK